MTWYYKALAGINPDENNPGFKNIILKPNTPSDIKKFNAWYNTSSGKISVSWNEEELTIDLPKGLTADFYYGNIIKKLSGGIHEFKRIN